jgi:hypothetical protein
MMMFWKKNMEVKMKIMEMNKSVNFVDENNILLGYDTEDQCCEDAGWFISEKVERDIVLGYHSWHDEDIIREYGIDAETEGFNFDIKFHEIVTVKSNNTLIMEDMNMAVFRLCRGSSQIFLHLFNCHNGYYEHGFTLMEGMNNIVGGKL